MDEKHCLIHFAFNLAYYINNKVNFMQLTNVSIEVAPGYYLSGGSYDKDTLFANLERFKFVDGDGVLSVQGNYPNGDVLIWTRDSGFNVMKSDSSVAQYDDKVKVKNQKDLIGSHVMDRYGEWGHGEIKGFRKDDEGNVLAVCNFPIVADKGWEVSLHASQIQKLPNSIDLTISDKDGKLIDKIDVTKQIIGLDEDHIIRIKDSHTFGLKSLFEDLGIEVPDGVKLSIVDSICSYFGKHPIFGQIPENLIDDGVMRQVKVIVENSSNDLDKEMSRKI